MGLWANSYLCLSRSRSVGCACTQLFVVLHLIHSGCICGSHLGFGCLLARVVAVKGPGAWAMAHFT